MNFKISLKAPDIFKSVLFCCIWCPQRLESRSNAMCGFLSDPNVQRSTQIKRQRVSSWLMKEKKGQSHFFLVYVRGGYYGKKRPSFEKSHLRVFIFSLHFELSHENNSLCSLLYNKSLKCSSACIGKLWLAVLEIMSLYFSVCQLKCKTLD